MTPTYVKILESSHELLKEDEVYPFQFFEFLAIQIAQQVTESTEPNYHLIKCIVHFDGHEAYIAQFPLSINPAEGDVNFQAYTAGMLHSASQLQDPQMLELVKFLEQINWTIH